MLSLNQLDLSTWLCARCAHTFAAMPAMSCHRRWSHSFRRIPCRRHFKARILPAPSLPGKCPMVGVRDAKPSVCSSRSSSSGSLSAAVRAWHRRVEVSFSDSDQSGDCPQAGSYVSTGAPASFAREFSAVSAPRGRPVEQAPHNRRTCNPCVFFYSHRGCRNDADCQYCHWHPQAEIRHTRQRPRKQTRDQLKDSAECLLALHADHPDALLCWLFRIGLKSSADFTHCR